MTAAADAPAGHRWLRLFLPLWCAALTGVVLWPFAVAVVTGWGRGDALLLRDMSVPGTMALNDAATGADGVARAVPQDAVLALLSPLVPPPVVVGLVMLGCGVAGSLGAAGLARRCGAGGPGQMLASFLVVWNPYLAERLLQGHWSVVAAGTLLPLVALLALERRRVLVVVLTVCALTPTGLVLAVVTAVVASGRRRFSLVPVVAGAALSLPWAVPSVVDAAGTLTDAAGASLFAARAEPAVGTLGALTGLGGIWNADAVPAHRVPVAGVLLAVVCVVVAAVPTRQACARDRDHGPDGNRWPGPLRRLSWLAAGAVLVPALLATPPGLAVLGGLLGTVPGAGLLRDTQKFVVLALPALVVLVARVDVLVPRGATYRPVLSTVTVGLAGALAFLQVPALPADLTELRPVTLDARYATAVTAVEGAGGGRTLLWPPGNYRLIDRRPVLDPLLKMLPGAPVDPGYLVVDGKVVDGDPAAVRLLGDLAAGHAGWDDLADAGIDLVLVEGDAADAAGVGVPALFSGDGTGRGADRGADRVTDREPGRAPVWSDGGWALYRVR